MDNETSLILDQIDTGQELLDYNIVKEGSESDDKETNAKSE